ncbi:MAG: hypothetical protein ACM3OB_06415 [Acidobacteriota bacterium]
MRARPVHLFAGAFVILLGAVPSTAQNLFINPGFATDIHGWSVSAGGSASWSSDDAAGLPGSGSLELENSAAAAGTFVGAYQCVAAVAGSTYDVHSRVRIPTSQSAQGSSAGQYFYYSAAGCAAASLISSGGFGGPTMTDHWEDLTTTLTAPPATQSLKLVLGTVKSGAGGQLTSLLDEAFVGVQVSPCTPSETDLCLAGGRFRIQATWRTPNGQSGQAHAVRLTADTGYFWFFNDSNVEMVVKVLNGCGVNSRWWVFAAGLTNVRVDWTATDLDHGTPRNYSNPQGTNFAPRLDTQAFATCP